MNFLLAILLLAMFSHFGSQKLYEYVEIVEGSPAENAGLLVGDKIITVNDIKVDIEDQDKA